VPMEQNLELQTAYPQLYAPYFKQKVISGALTLIQLEKMLNSNYLRLRAGSLETDLSKFKRKEKVYIYDHEIEKVSDWENKLKYSREELMSKNRSLRVGVINGFKFSSFENIRKLSKIPGFVSMDAHIACSQSYPEFKESFDSIAEWSSPRDGIKYYFGHDINPASEIEVVRNFCLSVNKYLYTKGLLKACEFIVDDKCEIASLNKLQKDFQYWTTVRVGDKTLKEYLMSRNKVNYDEYYKIISRTPFKSQFDRVCNITKNEVKKAGWYYHD